MHPLRRKFRKVLYVMLGISFLFAGSMTYLRMNYHHLRDNPDFREAIFKAHIAQMQLATLFQNDEQKLQTAIEMVNSSLFSQSYWVVGTREIEELSDEGYAPAQTTLPFPLPGVGPGDEHDRDRVLRTGDPADQPLDRWETHAPQKPAMPRWRRRQQQRRCSN